MAIQIRVATVTKTMKFLTSRTFLPKPPAALEILSAVIFDRFIVVAIRSWESVVYIEVKTISSIARGKDCILDSVVPSLIIKRKPEIPFWCNTIELTFGILRYKCGHLSLPSRFLAKSSSTRLLSVYKLIAIQAKILSSTKYRFTL